VLYFSYFVFMPWYSRPSVDRVRPVPDRLTDHAHA